MLISILLNSCSSINKVNALTYLGQSPPGPVPKLFAPTIIQTEFREGEFSLSPDLTEVYFRRRGGKYVNNTVVVVKYVDGRWEESIVGPSIGEPFISTDGQVMYLGRNYMERTANGWSELKSLGKPFEEILIMRLTASANGTYYFDAIGGEGNISYSRLRNGQREEPLSLTKEIDMGIAKAHPFIAPDESYLIWDDQRESGHGGSDLYISFRLQNGSWSSAINMGDEINTESEDAYGSVSSDGKYFFFHRGYGGDKGDIFWVDAQIIEKLRPY